MRCAELAFSIQEVIVTVANRIETQAVTQSYNRYYIYYSNNWTLENVPSFFAAIQEEHREENSSTKI